MPRATTMSTLMKRGIADAATAFYCECEFCNGLFPMDLVAAHVKLGHETELSAQVGDAPKRRVFACTDVTDTWYDYDHDETGVGGKPGSSNGGGDKPMVKVEPSDQISSAITMESDGDFVVDNSGSDSEQTATTSTRSSRHRRAVAAQSSRVISDDGQVKRLPVIAKRRLVINDGDDEDESDSNAVELPPSPPEVKRSRKKQQPRHEVADFDYAHIPDWLHEKIFGEFFTTKYGYLDHYVTAMDHMPAPDQERFPEIPEKFETRYALTKTDSAGIQSIEFRARISNLAEAREWMLDYRTRSGVEFYLQARDRLRAAHEHRIEHNITRWMCEFRSKRSKKNIDQHTNCPMKVRICIAPSYQLAGIVITGQHNHPEATLDVSNDINNTTTPSGVGSELPPWLRKKIHEEFFTTQHGYLEEYVRALDDMPRPDRFPDIPELFDTRYALEKTDEDGIKSTEFRARISNLTQAQEWIKDYATRTDMRFRPNNDKVRNKTVRTSLCEMRRFRWFCASRRWGKTAATVRPTDLNCPIKIRIMVAPQYHIAGILITGEHNHPRWADMRVEHGSYYRPLRLVPGVRPGDERFDVLQQTARDFRGYIGQGMVRKEMLDLHEKTLRARPDFKPEMLNDPVYMPTKQMIDSLRQNFQHQLENIAKAEGTTVESQAAYVHLKRELAKRGRKSVIAPKTVDNAYIPECEDEAIMDFDFDLV